MLMTRADCWDAAGVARQECCEANDAFVVMIGGDSRLFEWP